VRLFVCRIGWRPTVGGWLVISLVTLAPVVFWWLGAERFFCETSRVRADILVVEVWVGTEALRGAAEEFRVGGYRWIVTTGGYSDDRWSGQRASYPEMARDELILAGVPKERILVVPARNEHGRRTHAAATAAWGSLRESGETAKGINVFTLGSHARRSRLIFGRTAPSGTKVGVIACVPKNYAKEPWWKSSDRSEDLIKETVAFAIEVFKVGGWFDTPASSSPVVSKQ
jgi:hypothetical protein